MLLAVPIASYGASIPNDSTNNVFGNLFGNRRITLSNDSYVIFSALDRECFFYHPVTGAGLEQSIAICKNKPSTIWKAGGKIGYAFSANRLTGELNTQLNTKRQRIHIYGGSEFADWKGDIGDDRFTNSVIALFNNRTYKSLFFRKYASLEYSARPTYSIELHSALNYNNIEVEENRCNFSIFHVKKHFPPNIPINNSVDSCSLSNGHQTSISFTASYTPRTIGFTDDNGRPIIIGSLWPTFTIGVEHGMEGCSNYTHLHASVLQRIAMTNNSMFKWEIDGGKFLNSSKTRFYQWKHFSGSNKRVALTSELDGYVGFVMFRPYELSTNKWYSSLKVAYITPKLIFRQIPLLAYFDFNEELYLKNATVNGNNAYTEMGYGWGNVLNAIRMTVFTSFVNSHFEAVKFRMAIDL